MIGIRLAAVTVLGTLVLGGCGGGDPLDIDELAETSNVTAPWPETEDALGVAFLAQPNETITMPYLAGLTGLGSGYYSMPENFTPQCFGGKTEVVESTTTRFNFQMADSMQDVLRSTGFSISTSGGFGLFHASAAFTYFRELKINAHTVVAVSKYEILGNTKVFETVPGNPTLTPPPVGLDPENTYRLCGDYFVYGIQGGSTLYAIITIEAGSSEEKIKITKELKASYGNAASVEGSHKSEFAQKLSQYKASIQAFAIGCKPIEPMFNWDDYVKVLRSFNTEVAACKNNFGSPVTVTLRKANSYYEANGIRPRSVSEQREALDRMLNFSVEYQQLNNDLDHFRLYIGSYDLAPLYRSREDAVAAVVAAKGHIQDLTKKIEQRMKTCVAAPYDCHFFDEVELPMADYPDNLRKTLIPGETSSFPATCDELNGARGSMRDGEYTLYFGGILDQPFQAYCTNMHSARTGDPKTYLTLNSATNVAQFKGIWTGPQLAPKHWSDLTTNYSRVRIDVEPDAAYIDLLDDTYASNAAEAVKPYPAFCEKTSNHPGFLKVPYGIAARSNSAKKLPGTEPADPISMIDLRGTKFRIAPDEYWDKKFSKNLVESYSREKMTNNRQTVSMQVMGNIGVACPSNYPWIKLEYCSECGGG